MTTNAESGATGAYQPAEGGSELVRVLDQYLADLQAGHAPDRAQLLAAHPDLASQLEQCLAGIEFIHQAAQPTAETPAQLGDFRIIREVGRGGMGVVYEAEQLSLKRKVALKVLRFGAVADAEVMQRFQREAETVARLHHTNIVPVFAVGEEHGVHYYAMQFIAGQSLAAVLEESQAQGNPLEPREIARWGLQAAEALAHAHQRGVIHRDIKPSNLLLDPEGVVWLTDFGLARRVDEVVLTATGVLIGTPRYMSPEQAAAVKQPVDHRTDIYSLGATLYELATAKPVFDADTPQGMLSQIQNAEPIAPRQVRGNLPRDLETIILKCLAKEPGRRYATAQALADDLRDFLNGRAVKARRPSLAERMMRWAKKQRRSVNVAVAAAVISALLVVGTAVAWNWYADWQLAQITISTSGPSLGAVVLDEANGSEVARFTVPTSAPQRLPPGSYQLRLEREGELSENYQFFVGTHERSELHVDLTSRQLWETSTEPGESFRVVGLEGKPDLVLVSERGLRRLDGATGKPVWPGDLVKLTPKDLLEKQVSRDLTPDRNKQPGEWDLPFAQFLQGLEGPVQPVRDLDGDGVADLVWASRTTTSLLAISGKTGQVLWWYLARPLLPSGVEESKVVGRNYVFNQAVLGQPLVLDLEGKPVFIAMFGSKKGNITVEGDHRVWGVESLPQSWVEAVDGRSGKPLWRYDLGQPYLGRDFRKGQTPYALAVIHVDGRAIAAILAGRRLFGLDLRKGKEVWPAHDLGFEPLGKPRFADLGGSGQIDSLVVEKSQENGAVWEIISLANRQPAWQTSPHTILPPGEPDPLDVQGPVPGVLHRGAKPVVLTLFRKWGNPPRGMVEAREGQSGRVIWSRRLGSGTWRDDSAGQLVLGPDLDGDGYRDVLVVTQTYLKDPSPEHSFLFVEALSGKDGHTLWRTPINLGSVVRQWGLEQNTDLAPLRWWQSGPDGFPLLVVSFHSLPDRTNQGPAYMIEPATGRLAYTLPQAGELRIADLNGDGIPDLISGPPLSGIAGQRLASAGGKLRAIRGAPPEPWRLMGGGRGRYSDWRPVQDFDGDGIADLVGTPSRKRVTVVSGRDGHQLWHAEISAGPTVVSALSDGDLDGDGVPDLLTVALNEKESDYPHGFLLRAISGRGGRPLWTTGIDAQPGSHAGDGAVILKCGPMAAKESPDVIWSHSLNYSAHSLGEGKYQVWLARLSGRDGTIIWNQALHEPRKDFSWLGQPAFCDLDGDGVLDLLLWVPVSRESYELRALSGADGHLLWKRDPIWLRSSISRVPCPTVGDLDGDGIPEVAITTPTGRQGSDHLEVVVLNGRTGETKWTWGKEEGLRSWDLEWVDVQPRIVNQEKGKALCIRVDYQREISKRDPKTGRSFPVGKSGSQLVLLDTTRGQVLQRRELKGHSRSAPTWVHDLDGDGRDEVVFVYDGKVWATGSGTEFNKDRWVWQIPEGRGEIVSILPAGKSHAATVVVTAGESVHGQGGLVYGLAGPTGQLLWRCETGPHQPAVELLSTNDPLGRPRILFPGPSNTNLICRVPVPVDPKTGRYTAPPEEPRTYGPLPQDPRLARPLPWVSSAWRGFGIGISDWKGIFALTGTIILPGLLLRWAIRRKSWKVGLLAVLSVGITLGGVFFFVSGVSRYEALVGGIVVGFAWLLFLGTLTRCILRRQRSRFGVWLVVLFLVTLAYAGWSFQRDTRFREPIEYYSWDGWYTVFFPGVFFTGVLLLALFLLGRLVRLLRWGFRRLRSRRVVITGTAESPG